MAKYIPVENLEEQGERYRLNPDNFYVRFKEEDKQQYVHLIYLLNNGAGEKRLDMGKFLLDREDERLPANLLAKSLVDRVIKYFANGNGDH